MNAPERRHCSRNPKWGPSDFGCKKLDDAMTFGGPRSSFVRPGAHSARHQDSRSDWTRVAWLGLSSPPALTRRTPTKRSALRLRGGRRTPLVAYAPSLSWAPPMYSRKVDESGVHSKSAKVLGPGWSWVFGVRVREGFVYRTSQARTLEKLPTTLWSVESLSPGFSASFQKSRTH